MDQKFIVTQGMQNDSKTYKDDMKVNDEEEDDEITNHCK
jgi:hypothetical protein